MHPVLVINLVGLTARHLGGGLMPRLAAFAARGQALPLRTVVPAVTCSVQASFMTGLEPQEHGVVGNGWLFRDQMEIWLWRQSNKLVTGEKIWEAGKRRDEAFTCANLFWWYNMAASHDIGVTPRPIYKADGRKLPDCYTKPADLRERLTAELGPFPLFQFWGPATSITATRWIAQATQSVIAANDPTLTLAYLPHLDYDLQRFGPDEAHPAVAKSLAEADDVTADLIDFAQGRGRKVILLSEYGIMPVDRPVHLNRVLREAGLLALREEDGGLLLDPVASQAFALADHQIAHVYVADPARIVEVRALIAAVPGVAQVHAGPERAALGLDHPRSGEIVALAEPRAWFSYYYWNAESEAPDFARTVEIHRKPGYDPVELFLDPAIRFPKLAIGSRLIRRKLGFRALMDVIPLDAGLVKGSHGRLTERPEDGPVFISDRAGPEPGPDGTMAATAVKAAVLEAVFGPG